MSAADSKKHCPSPSDVAAMSEEKLLEIAESDEIPDELQTALVNRALWDYQQVVALHESQESTFLFWNTELPEYILALANNQTAFATTLEQLAVIKVDYVIQYLCSNPNSPTELLAELARDLLHQPQWGHAAVLDNPNCDRDLALWIAETNKDGCYSDDIPEALFTCKAFTPDDLARIKEYWLGIDK